MALSKMSPNSSSLLGHEQALQVHAQTTTWLLACVHNAK